ncbi:MAG TPA: hypothetical protein VGW12_19135 [Pyrinomonadaceae bacterium]|nr:hypothetical protein [Pyrinomonadaceae bacterium]
MELTRLPEDVLAYLPGGYEPQQGVWLVLPSDDGTRNSIVAVNSWMPDLDMYPESLGPVIWFGEDGVGNFLGWDPERGRAVLWNPEDEEPWREGTVSELWQFILNGYADAA